MKLQLPDSLDGMGNAAFGIMLGAAPVACVIEVSRIIGWPIGNDGLVRASVGIAAAALGIWIGCRFRPR